MAFAFSKINRALGVDDEAADKQDIFAAPAGAPDATAAMGPQAIKTSTAGDLGSPQATSPQSKPAAAGVDPQSASRAALRANAGKTTAPRALQDISSRIVGQQTALQNEATAWTTAEQDKQKYGATDAELESAIGGDAAAGAKVTGLFDQKLPTAFTGFVPQTDVEVADVERTKSDRGLTELLARGQGPSYSAGEGAFDLASLRSTAGFDDQLRDIQARQEDLRTEKRGLGASATKGVEEFGAAALAAGQKGATDSLTGKSAAIEATNAEAARLATVKLDAMRAQGGSLSAEDVRSVLADLTADFGELDPRVVRFIQQAADSGAVDSKAYQKFRETPYASGDFYDETEATRFNSIMGLLGRGGELKTAGLGAGEGEGYSFDKLGYSDAVRQGALGMRGEADKVNASDIDAIMAGAQGRADGFDKGWLGADSDAEARRLAYEARGSGATFYNPGLAEIYAEHNPSGFSDTIDPSKFYTADTRDLIGKDVLNDDEVTRLRALGADSGLADVYERGTAATTSQAGFDKAGYLAALTAKLQGYRDERVNPVTTPSGSSTPAPPAEVQVKNAVDDVYPGFVTNDSPGARELANKTGPAGSAPAPMSIAKTLAAGAAKTATPVNKALVGANANQKPLKLSPAELAMAAAKKMSAAMGNAGLGIDAAAVAKAQTGHAEAGKKKAADKVKSDFVAIQAQLAASAETAKKVKDDAAREAGKAKDAIAAKAKKAKDDAVTAGKSKGGSVAKTVKKWAGG